MTLGQFPSPFPFEDPRSTHTAPLFMDAKGRQERGLEEVLLRAATVARPKMYTTGSPPGCCGAPTATACATVTAGMGVSAASGALP